MVWSPKKNYWTKFLKKLLIITLEEIYFNKLSLPR